MSKLSPNDRAFLTLVERATFSNPFAPARHALDLQIAGVEVEGRALIDVLVAKVEARLEALGLDARDPLVESARLFVLFHRFADDFDAFIEAQAQRDTPLSPPFARELLRALATAGISDERGRRLMAIFYQMRRAYFFIATGLIGVGPSMGQLRAALWDNVFTGDIQRYERLLWDRMEDFSTLLLGETGSGKGAAAAAIGRSGYIPWMDGRFESSFEPLFVPLNLSEHSEGLIESALFGHERGAFTGAVSRQEGLLSRCQPHGVAFLDEIGELTTTVQIKLLRVLEERAFLPVGGAKPQRFSGRIIAATHQPLDALRASGRFREDFYFRLCSDEIQVPPLRVRLAEAPEELGRLVDALLTRMLGREDAAVAEEITARIAEEAAGYAWPGNVRELAQRVRRVLLRGSSGLEPVDAAPSTFLDAVRAGRLDAGGLLSGYCQQLYAEVGRYTEVARRTGLDRRTVKRYIQAPSGAS